MSRRTSSSSSTTRRRGRRPSPEGSMRGLGPGRRAWSDAADLHARKCAVAFHRREADLVHDVHAFHHLAEDRVLALERGLLAQHHEELAAAGVGPGRFPAAATTPRAKSACENSALIRPSPPVP